MEESATKYQTNIFSSKQQYIHNECHSESDVSLGEQDFTKEKLYPLPGGTFILSDKPPVIITPRHDTPIYHRSTPAFFNSKQYEGDSTSRNHYSQVPFAVHRRRLNSVASTSDLLLTDHRRAPSRLQLQRSISVQPVHSHTVHMVISTRKQF